MKDERSEDDLCVSILSFLFYLISLKHFLSMYYSLTQCGSQTLIPGTRSTSTTLELVEMQILRLGLGISIRNWGWAYQFWYCKSSLWHWYRLKFLPRTPTVWEQTFQHVSQVQDTRHHMMVNEQRFYPSVLLVLIKPVGEMKCLKKKERHHLSTIHFHKSPKLWYSY